MFVNKSLVLTLVLLLGFVGVSAAQDVELGCPYLPTRWSTIDRKQMLPEQRGWTGHFR